MSKSRNSQLALGRLTVSAFVSAMLQMCARDALAAGPTQLPIACAGAGVACGTNTAGANFASYGAATTSTNGKTLTVNQTTNAATLNWASFNVTSDGKVVFQQPSSSSVALNRIYDANPSSIFGSVSANGQIYLINANGILFGSTATVNVAGLVASSLYMTDSTFQNGIASASNNTAVANPYANAALQPFLDSSGNVIPSGSVTVQAGAQITAADSGRIILAAPIVENGGTITAPDGQIILAAGQSVYLTPSSTSDLRGLVVQVDGSSGNLAANQVGGTLSAPRGNISLVGLAVNQDGRISATTTVAANGSIILEAGTTTSSSPTQATQGGALEIGANSITEILPEYSDTTTAVADQTQLQSEIDLTGQQVLIHGGTITAPSGLLNVVAATNPSVTSQGQNDPNAEIRVDSGTTIDLSGSDAVLPVSYNLLTVQLRGAELENDPTQRGGALQGQTVTVDVRADGGKGTALADLSAEIAAMPQNIAQRTETGGTATFKSEGDVVMGSGVSINVSGGQTTFTGGQVQTTELIGANGKLYDIGSASSLLTYTGLVNPTFTQSYNEWGVQQVVATPGLSHYESGYVQGANAGTIQVAAPSMSIGATLRGSAVSGPYQRGLTAPLGGTLIIGQTPGTLVSTGGLADFLSPEIDFTSLVSPVVIPDGTPLPTQAVQLSTSYLTSDGFSNIQIYGNSRVTLPSGLPLDMPSGTSLLIEAPRIDVNSSITDLAGSLSFINVATVDSSDSGLPRLGVSIGSGVTLDVSGQWTNDNLQVGSVGTGLTLQNAGSIEVQLNTTGSALALGNQVSLKADGGAWLESNGTISDGKGGSITLDANPAQAAVQIGQGDSIEGFGVGTASGGSFSLTAPYIQVSQGSGTAWTSAQTVDELSNPGSVLNVYAPLFSDYGFSSVSLTATGAATGTNSDVLTLASNTTIDALTRTWELDPGFQSKTTGGELAGFVQTVTLPEYSRPVTDVSLNVLRESALTAGSTSNPADLGDRDVSLGSSEMGSLDIEAGSSILTDPGAQINLQSVGSMNIAGTLRAPGGDISATIVALTGNQLLDPGYQASQNLFIAPTAVLDVSGTSIVQPNAQNLPFGSVLPGGTVTLDAERGYVVVSAGSLVNISGTSAVLDVADTTAAGGYELETVGSAGGTFSVSSPESISLLGGLEGTGGVGTAGAAAAGALVVDLTRLVSELPGSDNIGNQLPQFPDSTPLEIELVDSTQGQTPSAGTSNLAILGVQQINASGIDSLTLAAADQTGAVTGVVSVNTNEPLTLGRQLTISSPVLTVAPGYNAVLSAPYVQIGSPLESSTLTTPTSGVGSLTVNTDQLNLTGIFTLQSLASATFNSSGDVQLEGTGQSTGDPVGMLMTAGNLTINAERIYPDTNTIFTLSSVPTDGSPSTITLGQVGASPGAPLSAAGTLNVSAPNIEIGGSLYAPFGTINLTATNQLTLDNNSLVSVSGAGLEIPYGETQYQGGQWFYTNPGSGQVIVTGTPTKAVNLTAPQIKMGSGATVDLSGGGDLYAYEFVPGTGGLTDNLASGAISGLYAIIPSQRGLAAPYDPMISGSSSQTLTVYLSGYAGLPAGYYSLLPARYGLLPGADLIEVEPSYTSAVGGRIGTLADGTAVVAGYLTSGTTGLYGSTTEYEGFAIYPGSYSQKLASYTISNASTYFSGTSTSTTAVPVPADGGTLNVDVLAALNNSLDLEGKVLTTAAKGGSGAQVNVSAPELEVTSGGTGSGGIVISSSVLQSWNAGSITLGGESSTTASGGNTIKVTANTVTVDTGVNLSADQITLVAQQGIEVQQGATLASSSGAAGTTLKTLPTATAVTLTDSTGNNSLPEAALLSVSDIGLAEVTRTGATSTGGATITLDPGSTLKSGGALAFDTPGQITTSGANVNGTGASWSLSSTSVAFVNSGTALPKLDTDTLNIDSGLLSSMQQAGAIRIASAGNIDVYTPVSLGATSASSAPTLSSLTLIGSTINNDSGGGNVVLGANTVILQGVSATAAAAPTAGTAGNLTLVANTLQVGPGAVTVNGFANTLAQVGGAFEGYETGSLNVGGSLQISAVELTAMAGAPAATSSLAGAYTNTALSSDTQYISNTTIASTDALTIGAPTQLSAGTTLPTALGGSLSLQGTSIEDDGAIVAPSGIVNLNATTGSIHLASGASINVGGQTVAIVDQTTSSSGGMVTLTAKTAGSGITLDAGSTINVSGSGSAPAGSLSITGAGAVDLSGTLNGAAGSSGGTGGSFAVNAGTLTNGLTPLATTLTSGGFTNSINVEAGSGDLDLAYGTNLTANNVVLSADSGKVDIAGTITADSGAQRGFIGLYGGTNVTLESTGQLHADGSGSAGRGGEIDISSTCITCSVTLASGSQISAQGAGQMGELVLQAPLQGTSVAINAGSSGLPSIVGNNVGQVIIEATTTFNESSASNINTDIANAESNVTGAASSILSNLQASGPAYSVQTGVIINSAADLTLSGISDLYQYSSQNVPGSVVDLTVRTSGNLAVSGTISDGYTTGQGGLAIAGSTASGTLSLVAGANTNSADPLATLATSSAGLTLNNSAIVRTGTGDLNLVAAGDVTFGKGAAAYTSGLEADGVSPLAVKNGTTNDLLSYATGGGNVLIQAGGDVVAQALTGKGNYSVTGWQVHLGSTSQQTPAQYGIDLAGFDWNVGALGGGDVTVAAKGNITELSAATADSRTTNGTQYGTGGGLSMTAGGDIGSVQVYVSSGKGTLTAGGGLTAPLTYTVSGASPVNVGSTFALGYAEISVWARNSVLVDAVYNPTVLEETSTASQALYGNYFTYSSDSSLSLQSTTGNVGFEVQPVAVMPGILGVTSTVASAVGQNQSNFLDDLPPNLTIQALQGDINLDLANNTYIYPSGTGQLSLLAGRDITNTGSGALYMADNLASTLPTAAATTGGTVITPGQLVAAVPHTGPTAAAQYAAEGDIYAGDTTPALITAGEDIDNLDVSIPKAAEVVAGRDIVDLTYYGQNANSSDITLISAGRDIVTPLTANQYGISLGGQGALDVFAGRNIDLGFSNGIVTTGSFYNPNLPSSAGADLTVMAGLGSPQNADDTNFLNTIIAPSSTYQSELISYVESENGQSGLTFANADADFQGFSQPLQQALINQVFFNELLLSGREANAGTGVGFSRGYAAIDALFPSSRTGETETNTGSYTGPYSGDIDLIYSEIYTQSGGNINILAPGGQINVGLAVPPANVGTKAASQLGIVAEGAGNVDIYSLGSVNVNAARIFTLGGGNILIWSDLGDIDAGNGSKASLSIPPPTIQYTTTGQVIFNYSGAVAGSGIRTIQTSSNEAAGSVDLDAPVGTVDAGDAGIGAAGNINIAAQHVIGANNINFGGTATGVPPEVSSLGASLSGATAAATSSATTAESKAQDQANTQSTAAPLAQTALSWLDVFVTGVGEENCKPEDTECLSRQKAPQ